MRLDGKTLGGMSEAGDEALALLMAVASDDFLAVSHLLTDDEDVQWPLVAWHLASIICATALADGTDVIATIRSYRESQAAG